MHPSEELDVLACVWAGPGTVVDVEMPRAAEPFMLTTVTDITRRRRDETRVVDNQRPITPRSSRPPPAHTTHTLPS